MCRLRLIKRVVASAITVVILCGASMPLSAASQKEPHLRILPFIGMRGYEAAAVFGPGLRYSDVCFLIESGKTISNYPGGVCLWNRTNKTIIWSAKVSANSWFKIRRSGVSSSAAVQSGSLKPNKATFLYVEFDRSTMSNGRYRGTITFSADVPKMIKSKTVTWNEGGYKIQPGLSPGMSRLVYRKERSSTYTSESSTVNVELEVRERVPPKTALIVLGNFLFNGWPNPIGEVLARNTAREAICDFRRLGYAVTKEFHSTAAKVEAAIRTKPEPSALCVVAHGDGDGFRASSGNFVLYKNLRPSPTWTKKWGFVILNTCESDSLQSRDFFDNSGVNPPNYYHGWATEVKLWTIFFWQYRNFPSQGPHDSEYEVIDIESLDSLSAEQLAIPYEEDFDIPANAEDAAKTGFIELAKAHNALIEGKDDYLEEFLEAFSTAYQYLFRAHREGWEDGSWIAGQLRLLTDQAVLVTKDSERNLVTALSREGEVIRIGVLQDSIGEYWANRSLTDSGLEVELLCYASHKELLVALLTEEIETILVDAVSFTEFPAAAFEILKSLGTVNVLPAWDC